VLSRASGVDMLQADGLADALDGVDAVIDVLSTPETEPDETRAFFGASTQTCWRPGSRQARSKPQTR
jgi:hypothetical protein